MICIEFQPDPIIEPGHQWLVVPNNPEGLALADLLMPRGDAPRVFKDEYIHIPHDHVVDQNIVNLIDQLAHARFSAPSLVQLRMVEDME